MIKFPFFWAFLCWTVTLCAQDDEGIQTKNELGVEALVRDVLVKGNCRNVSNITAIGNESLSIGQFENAADFLGINDGIILSTGTTMLAEGPNNSGEASFAFDVLSNDPDLGALATDELYDVTGIEFDFVPLDNSVTFKYVFASEEYCEFVGTSFNDVFGFFVSGPGINGPYDNNAINVANLFGTNIDVSINTINHIDNTEFYVSNITNLDAEACEINFTSEFQNLIEYDGFTVPLTASFQVIPCETYRIRLVIGDVGDPNLDSAVFLETNSFDLGEKVNVRAEVPGREDPIAYESCLDGQYVFTRSSSSNISESCIINYNISAESEATNGVDFVEIPLSVTIPAGATEFILPITIIEDNILEGPENLKLEFQYACDCIDPVLSELIIDEASDFIANFDDINACANQAFNLSPEIVGGVPPFDFIWNTGATTEVLQENITTPTQFLVTITDFCGITEISTVDVGIQEQPTATLTGNYNLCETISSGIPVQFEGNPPWSITYQINGIDQTPIENIQTDPFFIDTQTEGSYVLTSFNDAYCAGNVVNSTLVEYTTFDVVTEVVSPSCINIADGSITITQLDAIPPFTVDWNVTTTDYNLLEERIADTYILTIVDGNGCEYQQVFDLNAITDDINLCAPYYIPNIFSPNEDGFNDIFSIHYDATSGIENILSMQIFDRWGSLVFEQSNFVPDNAFTIGWKGDFKDRPLDSGIYVYQILIAFEDGRTKLASGDIMLFR